MTTSEPSLRELGWRLDAARKDHERLERTTASRDALELEVVERTNGDDRLQAAIAAIAQDVGAIKEGQKWAFRLVASTLFLTAVGVIVALVQKGSP